MNKTYYIIFLAIIANFSVYAQADCYEDPSCRHTKAMLLESSQQWDHAFQGINTNRRCDTFDILHYTVDLDMTNFKETKLKGACNIRFKVKQANVKHMELDLLQLKVDSIIMGAKKLKYTYNDTLIQIYFQEALATQKDLDLTVYYGGVPQSDETWGGFYYKDGYAYNLGVGFAADPHNYGRVFHPCFDNFKERATYTYIIKTPKNKRAHCNGQLISENIVDGFSTRTWKLKDPIPTYLACIAVADYAVVKDSHQGIDGLVPIELAANAEDTANVKASFIHLKKAIEAYEYWFGPHRWSKVGYSLVPFRAGAMEHATNITYPMVAAKGDLRKESLMAHELGHSWWGNLVTCASAGDMWINEGMASYSVHLFFEHTYGKIRYQEEVKNNHYDVLKNAHLREKAYRPICSVPHEYTYGMHVYDKGAAVAHNMRWYMGDEEFRKGLQFITKEYAFQNLNTAGFRDALSQSTDFNMNQFFDDWVFRGGYPNFAVQEMLLTKKEKTFEAIVQVRQKLVGRTVLCKEVPIEVTFLDDNWNEYKERIIVSNALTSTSIQVPFEPTAVLLNKEHQLNQGRFDYQLKLTKKEANPKIQLRELGFHRLKVNSIQDSAWLHLEHHPVAPDSTQVPNGFTISKNHYWTVNGILPNSLDLEASLRHDDLLDVDLMEKGGLDSLVLLYRPTPSSAWQLHPNFIKKQTNVARFTFTMLKGDYALARGQVQPEMFQDNKTSKLSTVEIEQTATSIQLDLASSANMNLCVELYNIKGERQFEKSHKISKTNKKVQISTQKLATGTYFLKLRTGKGKVLKAMKLYVKQ